MDSAHSEIEDYLSDQAFHKLLGWLNQQGRHRFTGLFMQTPEGMSNAVLYDREQPEQTRLETIIPLDSSYCSFVCQSEKIFMVMDAMNDPRTQVHPSRESVRSYCGVPIYQENGTLWGTLCYYAPDVQGVLPEQVECLVEVGKRLLATHQLTQAAS